MQPQIIFCFVLYDKFYSKCRHFEPAASQISNSLLTTVVHSFQIRIHTALPYSIMGAICLQGAVLGLFLPETKGRPTLETMDDMKEERGMALHAFPNDKADSKLLSKNLTK